MPQTRNHAVMGWLFVFAFIVAFLVVFGGFVRLTRSGLSITEWNPISGAIPPIGEQAWLKEFVKYQQTPEFQQINFNMTLEEYQYIFYIEWIHRFIARLAGLVYAIPVFYFLFRKTIPFREFGIYFAMGMLFIAQAAAGWIMVSSGLIDRPSVSHFDLTIHLLLALSLLGLSLWTAFGHKYGFPDKSKKAKWSLPSKLALVSFILLVIQISYGGMTAGLKAGHVSDTWPLMFGKLVPPNLFNSWINLFETPQTIVFVHRWFAFMVLISIASLYFAARKESSTEINNGLKWLLGLVSLQIVLGILTVILHVEIPIALAHQVGALGLFALTIFFIHRLRALDGGLDSHVSITR
ncbi:MAG TPA: COX15/CtaA family protein [Anaerolineales bacterium]|nr:COX15/CtaA family protein [Anaerolineales bacterium]HLO32841.1 COX15/CtaA family protein [Anaerolineales bacterium]